MKGKIAIIGAGLMGRGYCQVFGLTGYSVQIYDAFPEVLATLKEKLVHELNLAKTAGLIEADVPAQVLERVSICPDLAQAVAGAEMVIECVPENMELKQNLFKQLDELCPASVILASGTSVMSITEIASASKNKSRIIGTHFWNPPHLLPLVEVVQTADTSAEVVDKTMSILRDAGKKPIHVKKDVPGFVANRMQHALWREAFHILDEGIADARTIDEAVRYSFGLRLPLLAPMENADMVGLDLTFAIHDYILKYLASNTTPSKTLQEKKKANKLGFKTEGHGFQNWTPEEMQASRDNLARYLMDVAIRRKNNQFFGN